MYFNNFLDNKEQVECFAYYYKDGFDERELSYLLIQEPNSILVEDSTNRSSKKLTVDVGIPHNYRNTFSNKSEILILLRLKIDIDSGTYFPYPRTQEAIRYMAIRIKCIKGGRKSIKTIEEELVKIGTVQQLLSEKIWK